MEESSGSVGLNNTFQSVGDTGTECKGVSSKKKKKGSNRES